MSEPIQEYTRPAIEAHIELSNNKTVDSSRVIFIVSDYEKAARTSLAVGESVYLPTEPPVNITILEKSEQGTLFAVNQQQEWVQNEEQIFFEKGAIQIRVAD
jgi:hypothetical protein